MKTLWVVFSTVALTCVGISHSHGAQAVDAVPDTAAVVLRWKAPETSVGKLADFVDAVQPGFGATVKQGVPAIGQAIGNPGLKGVDLSQDIWVVMFAEPQAAPTIVFLMTAKDVDDVKDALGSAFEVHSDGKLVAYSQNDDALEEIRQRLGGEGKSLLTIIDANSKKLFDSSDVALLVNVKQLVEDFSDELDQAEPQLDALIDQFTNALPEAQRPQLEAAFEMYRTLGKALLAGVRDTNSFVLGASFTKTAIRLEDRVQLTDGSASSKVLARQTTGDLALMGKLPADKAAYIGFKGDLSNMIEWSIQMTKGMLTDATDEQKAELDAAMKGLAKFKYEEMAMYLDLTPKAPGFHGGAVSVVNSTKGLKELSHKLLKSMSELHTPTFTQKTSLEPNAEKIGGVDVDRVTIKQEFDDSNPGVEIQQKVMAALFGDDGMQQLVMYQPTRTLQTTGGGKAEMQALQTAVDSTKTGDSAAATARKRFPAKANIIVLFDIARMVQNGAQLAGEQDVPVNTEALSGLKLEPSFIGFSIGTEANSLQSQLEVPVLQVQNIAKLIGIFQQQ
ncbi:MAG: hypothetical protein JWP89_6379 [Schlesneria sp.]|nr:hypothetical protein [Schlesneria sp.]